MKKSILNLFAVAAIALTGVSCENFLGVEPIDKLAADTYFKNELELQLYSNGLIQSYLPTADGLGAHLGRYARSNQHNVNNCRYIVTLLIGTQPRECFVASTFFLV